MEKSLICKRAQKIKLKKISLMISCLSSDTRCMGFFFGQGKIEIVK